jgi:hypothetical protein
MTRRTVASAGSTDVQVASAGANNSSSARAWGFATRSR